MDKHFSLLQKFVNYGHKMFYNIWYFSASQALQENKLECLPLENILTSIIFMGKVEHLPWVYGPYGSDPSYLV